MFFLFSKLLSFVLSPFTWIFIFIFLSLASKKANRKRNYLVIGIVVMLLFSNGFIFNEVNRRWEVPPVELNQIKDHDYVIVLGGFSAYDTLYHKFRLTNAGDRIWQTLQVYYQKKARKIFISGGSGKLLHQELTEADKVKGYLVSIHIPEKDIIIEPTSRNTHENAMNSAAWLKKHDPAAKCILITSAAHMPRALGCFKKEGLVVIPYSADWHAHPKSYDFDEVVVPTMYAAPTASTTMLRSSSTPLPPRYVE